MAKLISLWKPYDKVEHSSTDQLSEKNRQFTNNIEYRLLFVIKKNILELIKYTLKLTKLNLKMIITIVFYVFRMLQIWNYFSNAPKDSKYF